MSLTDVGTASGVSGGGKLPAGLYNAVSASYSGATANGVTWSPAASTTTGLPLSAFQILPVNHSPGFHKSKCQPFQSAMHTMGEGLGVGFRVQRPL